MSEISALTLNRPSDFYEIMDCLEKRLNYKGTNWRQVLKSLKLLDYCLHEGSESVALWAKSNLPTIQALRKFQFVDEDGQDVGQAVRSSATELASLIFDEERLRNERNHRLSLKDNMPSNKAYTSTASSRAAGQVPRRSSGDEHNNLRLALEPSNQERKTRKLRLQAPAQLVTTLPEVPEPPRGCGRECVFKCLKQVTCNSSLEKTIDESLNDSNDRDSLVNLAHTSQSPYKPLRRWQTRLVQILQTSGEIPKCSLTTVEFIDMHGVGIAGTDEIVTYSALSYVWGKQQGECTIICDDCPVQVSRNLAKFLIHLSRSRSSDSGSEYYWCDALCIDQQNPTEKAFQVRNMLRIFEKADIILGWLRPPDTLETLYGEPLLYAVLSSQQFQDPIVRHHEKQCTDNLARAQRYLREVCDDSFFRRIWIRQEMFAARKISLFLGGQQHSLHNQFDDIVSNLFHWLSIDPANPVEKALESENPLLDNRFGVDPRFQTMCRHFQHNGTDRHEYRPPAERCRYTVHWLRTLQDGASFHVTDPRDRVYGILGIISSTTTRFYVEDRPDIKTQNFPISYDKTVSEVYQDVIHFLIDTDHNLDCLTVVEDRRERPTDLPSWATDWRKDVKRSFIGVNADTSEDRSKYGLALSQVDLQSGHLRVEGVRCFSVRSLTAIKSWPSEMIQARTESKPHILFNTMGWMDDALVNLAPFHAKCDFAAHLQDKDAFYHDLKPWAAIYLNFYVPRSTRLDDIVVALNSAKCLFVLRPLSGRSGYYTLVGPALSHVLTVKEFNLSHHRLENVWGFKDGALQGGTEAPYQTFILV